LLCSRLAAFVCAAVALASAAEIRAAEGDDEAALEDLLEALRQIDDLGEVEGLEDIDAFVKEVGADLDLAMPAWDISGGLEAGVGYNTNVELAAFFPVSSGFVQGRADALYLRYPDDAGFEWSVYVECGYTAYFDEEAENASYGLAGAEVKWKPRDQMAGGAAVRYLYQSEVVDTSSLDEGMLGNIHAELSSVGFEPGLRWSFFPGWTVDLAMGARYDDYRPPLDDLADYDARLALERETEHLGRFSIGYRYLYRDYMEREQAAPGGTPLPGTRLAVTQQAVEAGHLLRWGGPASAWRLRTRMLALQSRDNGSGWYDYDRFFGRVALEWEAASWRIETALAWRDYRYLQQRANIGDLSLREREEWSASGRVERGLGAGVAVYLEIEWTDSSSNDPFLVYDQWAGVVGLRWSR